MTLLNFDVRFIPESGLIERTKKSRLAASGVIRRAARPSALRYVLSIILKCIRGAAKSLLLLLLVARIGFSRTAPLTQSWNGPGKVATLPCRGPRLCCFM